MAAMFDTESKFRRGWTTAGHGGVWNCNRTYCDVPYSSLPAPHQASDDLIWLDWVSPELRRVINRTSTLDSSENKIGNLKEILYKAQNLRLILPQPFLLFLRDPTLQSKVPTCTACYLELSSDLIPLPGLANHFLLRFLNDSQCCALWYLCLRPIASHAS